MNDSNAGLIDIKNYYDNISERYDTDVASELNAMIRNYVKGYFTKTVRPGNTVMDFGGGTGLDIPWLINNNNSIIFCEPSNKMRAIAEERVKGLPANQKISFVAGANTDFHLWTESNTPSDGVDAILADFNVLNNIKDINLLFEKITLIMNDGAHFIGTILDYSFFSLFRKKRSIGIKSLFASEPLRVDSKSNNVTQPVFIYNDNHLRMAYSNYFKLILDKPIPKSNFRLVHLQKFT